MKLILYALLLLACNLVAQEKVVIKGTVNECTESSIGLMADKLYIGDANEVQTSKLKDCRFNVEIALQTDQVVALNYKGRSHEIYVEPGNVLEVELMEDAVDSLTFSGAGAANNAFLTAFNSAFADHYDPEKMTENLKTLGIDAFESILFNNQKKQWNYFQEYPSKKDLTQPFNEYMAAHIKYYYYSRLLSYPVEKPGKENEIHVKSLPGIMVQGIDDKELVVNEDAFTSSSYRKFIEYYITYKASELNNFQKFDDASDFLEKKYASALKLLDANLFNYVMAKALVDDCLSASPITVKKLFTALSQSDSEKRYIETVNKKCSEKINAKEDPNKEEKPEARKEKKKRKGGKSSVADQPFEIIDVDGKPVVLDDFKGKVIYLDFWASWCGPCRQQFPYTKELKEMLTKDQKKQIVFLYISIDTSPDRWKGAIEKYQIEGVHARSPGGWSSSAAQYFKVTSIPRYMIIDKNGAVVNNNAKRPNAGRALLQDLLMLL